MEHAPEMFVHIAFISFVICALQQHRHNGDGSVYGVRGERRPSGACAADRYVPLVWYAVQPERRAALLPAVADAPGDVARRAHNREDQLVVPL